MRDRFPRHEFTSRAALRRWLERHHEEAGTFWLVTWKKHTGDRYLAYNDVVEELLCFGWVDARTNRLDDDRTMLLVARRKPGSTWSASNKERIARLEKAGLLQDAGRNAVISARADGSWQFLDDIDRLELPADLVAAMQRDDDARTHFDAFNDSAKRVILLWIKTAKKPETRAARIAETVRLAAMNIKAAHPEARGR